MTEPGTGDRWKIVTADCVEYLKTLGENYVDAVVTDPPYELSFMGRKWDSTGVAFQVSTWDEVFRVLKPGGHLLAFGGTRTYHRLACAVEDAGFEIRDSIHWVMGSGFPKSLSVHKAILKRAAQGEEVARCDCLDAGNGHPIGEGAGRGNREAVRIQRPTGTPAAKAVRNPDIQEFENRSDDPVRELREAKSTSTEGHQAGQETVLFEDVRGRGAEEAGFGELEVRARVEEHAGGDSGKGQDLPVLLNDTGAERGEVGGPSPETVSNGGKQPSIEPRGPLQELPPPNRVGDDSGIRFDSDRREPRRLVLDGESGREDEIQWVCSWCGRPESDTLTGGEGLGTALKPAHEIICVARKPLIGTVVENVLKFGTGAINIEATRVGSPAGKPWGGVHPNRGKFPGWPVDDDLVPAPDPNPAGRWPPNLVLTHSSECKPNGTKAVKPSAFYPDYKYDATDEPTEGIYGGGKGLRAGAVYQRSGNRPKEETVESWSCAEDCPVAELDRQSGDRPVSGSAKNGRPALGDDYGAGNVVFSPGLGNRQGVLHNDEGGASRFFPTFSWHTEEVSFIYEPKASRSEREAGLDSEIEGENGLSYKTSGYRCRKCGKWKVSGNPCTCPEPDFEPQSFARPNVANNHPTVKPIALLRWLVRLVTPPGGTVIDPFTGSGSTGCAAVVEGFRFIGIEKEPEYVEIAEKRIAYWSKQPKSQAPTNALAGSRAPSITLDAYAVKDRARD